MNRYAKNIILVMSGGTGSRFGADCPKQYCLMDGRMIIDYVMDACRKSRDVDEIVIVASEQYVDFCQERYGVPTVQGGTSRPDSVANGIQFVHDNYDCEKLIITNAVCPLATSEQYDKYFRLIGKNDFVLTTWKLAPALHRFDGIRVDRDDFFNVMEPDAYNFKMLYTNFNFLNKEKYIFHNMPADCKAFYCFDYPYTMKLTHPHDLKLLKTLYNDAVINPDKNKTLQTVNKYVSASYGIDTELWIENVQSYIKELSQKYSVITHSVNNQTEANIVYEAHSTKYGDIIIKFTPNKFFFRKELLYYKYYNHGTMAEMLGYDADYNAIIIKTIKPGIQIRFNYNNEKLSEFYNKIDSNLIPIEYISERDEIPTVMQEFKEYVSHAGKYTYEYGFRKSMEQKAYAIWDKYFETSPQYFLHRDLHKRNLLKNRDHITAIDPRGAAGPRAFEYVIQFIIELREDIRFFNYDKYNEMLDFFSQYVGKKELKAALFIFWIYKMNDYTFQKYDNNVLANWCKECILKLFFTGIENFMDDDVMPIIGD